LRLVEAPAMLQRVAVVGHVVVAIDQAGEHRFSGDIDDFGVGRPVALVAGGDRLDAVVAQHDRRALDRRRAGAVDQPAALEDLHGLTSQSRFRRS
jgi:hypothetical protein